MQKRMKRTWAARSMAAILSVILVLGFAPTSAVLAETTNVTETQSAEDILAGMTTAEKLEQMLMVAPRYYKDSAGEKQGMTVLTEEMEQYLTEHHFGGVILFAQNTEGTEQTVRFIDSIQKANAAGGAATQLLMAVDQEGGDVTRLNECVQGPGNMALTAAGSDEDVKEIYSIIGTEVAALGFNVNFSPDADVNSNPANPIIGVRSFSDDPQIVAEKVKLSLDTLQATGLIACPKHFPGHGDTAEDSHTGLPRIEKNYDEIREQDLLPFSAAVDQDVEMIMTAHIQYPLIETGTYVSIKDGKSVNLPATLSKTILTDILRNEMGYGGVIVSDSMVMDAIAKHFNPMDALEMAIRAGVDLILMPGDLSDAAGMQALSQGITLFAQKADADVELTAKIDEAVLRILKLKEKHGLLTAYDGSDIEDRVAEAKRVVSTKANHDKEWEITKRAITLVRNENNTLPLRKEGEKTVILTAYADEPLPMEYVTDWLGSEGRLPKDSTYEVHCYRKLDTPDKRQQVLDWIEGADNVIAISEMGSAAYLTGDSAGLLDDLIEKTHEQGGKFILMSVLLPYDVARFQKADAIVITYGARSMNLDPRQDTEPMKRYGPNIAAGLYTILQGEKPVGKLPVNLPKLNAAGDGYSTELLYERGYGLTYADGPDYSDEWVNGKWYDKDGNQNYQGTGSWKKNSKGWWYQDTLGWYPRNRWQKIDGKWYFFKADGYMAANEFVRGYWLNRNGSMLEGETYSWYRSKKGWWFGNGTWYAKSAVYTINGTKYRFDQNGYLIP